MIQGYTLRVAYSSCYACLSALPSSVILSHIQAGDAQRLRCLLLLWLRRARLLAGSGSMDKDC